jgi:hypothetical protein
MTTTVLRTMKGVREPTAEQQERIEEAARNKVFLSDKDIRASVQAIRQTIKSEEIRLRKKYRWLNRQDLLGFMSFALSVIALCITIFLYLKRRIHWSLVIPLMALPGSILHEIEHDLIHNLYFKGKQWMHHLMFVVIYFTKWSIPPWYRKYIHIRHHQVSGTSEDIEERLIGMGRPLDYLRWAMTFYPFANVLILDELQEDNPKDWSKHRLIFAGIPSIIPFTILWHLFMGYGRLMMGWTIGSYDPVHLLPDWGWPIVRDLSILLLLPNVLRQACLNLMASYSHYYGDIPHGNVYYQNQIIDHWTMWPFQLFSFNFGATHIIHHFVPNQPFYLRQMLAPKSIATMLKHGIRMNDWGIIRRNNRYFDETGTVTKRRIDLNINENELNNIAATTTATSTTTATTTVAHANNVIDDSVPITSDSSSAEKEILPESPSSQEE